MNKKITKKHIWISLGAALAVTLPVALSIACGKDTTPAVTPPVLTAEQTAQANIVNAPSTATASGSDTLLAELKESALIVKNRDAASKDLTLANFLATKTPTAAKVGISDVVSILISEIKRVWQLPAATLFDFTTIATLISSLGVDTAALLTKVEPYLKNYDGKNSSYDASWANYTQVWRYTFDPTNSYANLKTLLTALGLTPAQLNQFDQVLAAPAGQPSGVKNGERDILGFGGKTISPATPAVVAPAEAAARASIINDPGGQAGDTPTLLVVGINITAAAKAAAADVSLATYLANNSPKTWAVIDYVWAFTVGVRGEWKLPKGINLSYSNFTQLFTDLQIDTSALFTQTKAAIDNYAPTNAVATNVWDTLIKTFTQIFSPDNNHANLIKFFTEGTTPLMSRSDFNKIDTVLSAPAGQPSGLKKADGGDILGWGGTSILPTTAANTV